MKTLAALVFSILFSGVAHADEIPKIASIFKKGDTFTVTDPYCQSEHQIRGILNLKKIMKDWAVWKAAKREWGDSACVEYYGNSYRYEEKEKIGKFVQYFSEPVILDNLEFWIIEVEVGDDSIFTYVLSLEFDGLKAKASQDQVTAASPP